MVLFLLKAIDTGTPDMPTIDCDLHPDKRKDKEGNGRSVMNRTVISMDFVRLSRVRCHIRVNPPIRLFESGTCGGQTKCQELAADRQKGNYADDFWNVCLMSVFWMARLSIANRRNCVNGPFWADKPAHDVIF